MAEQIECLESEEIEIATDAPEEEAYSEDHDEENEEDPDRIPQQEDREDPDGDNDNEIDIDKTLEERAALKNLTVQNVKSIIHHVLKDKRVVAMAKKLADEEDTPIDNDEDIIPFEPRLTRSRVRQAVVSSVSDVNLSPDKLSSLAGQSSGISPCKLPLIKPKSHSLLDMTFSEDSSDDDEYTPGRETSRDIEDTLTESELGNEAEEQEEVEEEEEQEEVEEEVGGHGVDEEDMETDKEEENEQYDNITTPTHMMTSMREQDVQSDTNSVTTSNQPTINSEQSTQLSSTVQQIIPSESISHQYTPLSSKSITTSNITIESSVPATIISTTHSTTIDTNKEHVDITRQPVTIVDSTNKSIPTSTTDPPLNKPVTSTTISLTNLPMTSSQSLIDSTVDNDNQIIQEAASLLASLSDVILSPLKSPHQQTHSSNADSSQQTEQESEGEIARRTRSKFPLVNTDIEDIEASFNPPDVLPDEDYLTTPTITSELDEDDLEWQRWLADLMNPQSSQPSELEDQEDDAEYNFWAEQLKDDKEEFRTDRGVKIPQKEVDELIEELLNPNSGVFNTDLNSINMLPSLGGLGEDMLSDKQLGLLGVDLTSAYLLESLGLRLPVLSHTQLSQTPNKEKSNDEEMVGVVGEEKKNDTDNTFYLSRDQSLQLWDQVQQLLMQTFIMTRFEPSLVFLSQISAQAIEEILKWCEESKEGKNSPVWYVPAEEEARGLLQKYNPFDNDAVELITAYGTPPKIPDVVQDILMTHGLFWQYPQCLPDIGLYPVEGSTSQTSRYFTTTEDYLLVLGMDHYGSSAWKIIQEKLLPTKTPKQLQLRVKNLCSARNKADNVIKYFKRTGIVKIPFQQESSTRDDQSGDTDKIKMPHWVSLYHEKRVQKEKADAEKREKQLQQLRQLADFASKSVNINNSELSIGSKRNLTGQMIALESDAKRIKEPDKETNKTRGLGRRPRGSGGGRRGRRGRKKQPSLTPPLLKQPVNDISDLCKIPQSPDANYNQLLYMAGLEASDPTARYAYNYLTEVKATVMDDPDVYSNFLKLLIKARKKEWSPGKLYIEVQPLLQPWPHLIKLFMAFLDPKDALQVNAMAEKIEFEQVKAFVNKLETKYTETPLQLDELLSRMKSLGSQQDITRQQIMNNLAPMMQAHEDLLEDIKHFIHGTLPAKKIALNSYDDFEEVTLSNSITNTQKGDDFEETTIPDDWTMTPYSPQMETQSAALDIKDTTSTKTDQHLYDEQNIDVTSSQSTGHLLLTTECDKEVTNKPNIGDTSSIGDTTNIDSIIDKPEVDQTGIDKIINKESTSIKDNDTTAAVEVESISTNCQSVSASTWSREEDRLILQSFYGQANSLKGHEVAKQLNRSVDEVTSRYHDLLALYQSMTTPK